MLRSSKTLQHCKDTRRLAFVSIIRELQTCLNLSVLSTICVPVPSSPPCPFAGFLRRSSLPALAGSDLAGRVQPTPAERRSLRLNCDLQGNVARLPRHVVSLVCSVLVAAP